MSDFSTRAADNVAALRRTGLLDSPPEDEFDKITALASRLLRVPVSLVSLVDAERQFFKSVRGLAEPWAARRETPLTHSFCQHVVMSDAPLQVNDAREDPLVRDNRAVEELGVIAYLGMPLRAAGGVTIGSLCAIDSKPRAWTSDDFATLRDLAMLADAQISLREELHTKVVALKDELVAALAPARALAAARAGEAALGADVLRDFAAIRDGMERQARLLDAFGVHSQIGQA